MLACRRTESNNAVIYASDSSVFRCSRVIEAVERLMYSYFRQIYSSFEVM